MNETLKPIPNDDLASRVAWRIDESVDHLYMACTAIETQMREENGGDDHLSRAAVTTLLILDELRSDPRLAIAIARLEEIEARGSPTKSVATK